MKKILVLLTVAAMTLFSVGAFAYDIKVDDDTYGKVGVKGQIWYQYLDHGAPNGSGSSNDWAIKQGRIYFAGQVTNLVKFGFNYDFARGITDGTKTTTTWTAEGKANTGANSTSTAGVTDGYITLDFAKEAKLMTGIFRMAVSRVALQDSYAYLTVHAPAVAGPQYLSNQNNFRSAGSTLWGDLAEGMIRYNASVWDGSYSPVGTAAHGTTADNANTIRNVNPSDKPAYSGRVVINLMDPEKGYTNACCYLGKAKIFNIGAGYLKQWYNYADNSGTSAYTVKTVDAYLALDAITLEAAYLMYDDHQHEVGSKPKGYYGQVGYQIDKIMPAFRYEAWDNNHDNYNYRRYVGALSYFIDGNDARITLEYLAHHSPYSAPGTTIAALNKPVVNRSDPTNTRNYSDWTLQFQVQF